MGDHNLISMINTSNVKSITKMILETSKSFSKFLHQTWARIKKFMSIHFRCLRLITSKFSDLSTGYSKKAVHETKRFLMSYFYSQTNPSVAINLIYVITYLTFGVGLKSVIFG